uniref:Uncharacterized protein n=1 Tax=Timema bartmani TaxID=61472 RepID=A0A7R9ERJ3_9NEOP|nr:unnamed protein product [Timema bartmani]
MSGIRIVSSPSTAVKRNNELWKGEIQEEGQDMDQIVDDVDRRGKTTLSTPDQDSNLNLPVIDSLVYCKNTLYQHLLDKKVKNYSGISPMSTPNRDLNLNLPVISSPVYCEIDALDHAPRDTMRRSRLYLPWSLLAVTSTPMANGLYSVVFLSAHRVRTFRSRACISAAITRPVVMWVMDPTLLGALKRVNILQKTDSCYSSILRSHPLAIVSGEISTIKHSLV